MKHSKSKVIDLLGKRVRIYNPPNGEHINVANFANNKYDKRTTFNYLFFDFFDFFKDIIDSKEYEYNLDKSNVYILPEVRRVEKSFRVIRKYSNNDKDFSYSFSKKVLLAFKDIYSEINKYFPWQDDDYFIVPLKGGGFVINLFEIDAEVILPIEAKRVPSKKHGFLGLGMNIFSDEVQKVNDMILKMHGKEITFLEVCVASGMTTIGFLLDLHEKGVKPKRVKILTAASSIQGVKIINLVANYLEIDVVFHTGQLIENVSDFYDVTQDSIVYEDGSFVVKSPETAYNIVNGI